MSEVDIDQVRSRARAEKIMVTNARCAPSRYAHLDLQRRYLLLCSGVADPREDCAHCDLRADCTVLLPDRSAA
jgi:hypothetical protein